jgi:hypothetical protein
MANAIIENREETMLLGVAATLAKVSGSAMLKWVLRGCTAADGTRVHLEGVRMGARWFTSQEAVDRFSERLSVLGNSVRTATPTQAERRKQVAMADKEMEAAGA